MSAPLTPLQAYAEAIATRSRLARAVADAMEADDAERVAILAEQLDHADAVAADARTAAWQAAGSFRREASRGL